MSDIIRLILKAGKRECFSLSIKTHIPRGAYFRLVLHWIDFLRNAYEVIIKLHSQHV